MGQKKLIFKVLIKNKWPNEIETLTFMALRRVWPLKWSGSKIFFSSEPYFVKTDEVAKNTNMALNTINFNVNPHIGLSVNFQKIWKTGTSCEWSQQRHRYKKNMTKKPLSPPEGPARFTEYFSSSIGGVEEVLNRVNNKKMICFDDQTFVKSSNLS